MVHRGKVGLASTVENLNIKAQEALPSHKRQQRKPHLIQSEMDSQRIEERAIQNGLKSWPFSIKWGGKHQTPG